MEGGSLHSARPDGPTAGHNDARAIVVGKDLKEKDRVPHLSEPVINAEVDA
jgi:hypothetical protein